MKTFHEWLVESKGVKFTEGDFDIAGSDEDEAFSKRLKRRSSLGSRGTIDKPLRMGRDMEDIPSSEAPIDEPMDEPMDEPEDAPEDEVIPKRHQPFNPLRHDLAKKRARLLRRHRWAG